MPEIIDCILFMKENYMVSFKKLTTTISSKELFFVQTDMKQSELNEAIRMIMVRGRINVF